MYCGNNANINIPRGTRYDCLKKGIGVGLNLPVDPQYKTPHTPIVDKKLYCGNEMNVPVQYNAFGTTTECLQIGVGIGKSMKYKQGVWGDKKDFLKIGVLIFLIVFISLYLSSKLKWWGKLLISLASSLLFVFLIILYKHFIIY